MPDKRTVEDAARLLRSVGQQAADEAERTAIGFTLLCEYPEGRSCHGLYQERVEAERLAAEWEAELNRGIGSEPPFTVVVIPVQPAI